MQTAKIVQAVVLLMIIAMAASCTITKQYTSKLFPGNELPEKDAQTVALRFLELDKTDINTEGWVTTDIIMGRDTISNTKALDNLATTFPAKNDDRDSIQIATNKKEKTTITKTNITEEVTEEPIAKSTNANEVRRKRTREN